MGKTAALLKIEREISRFTPEEQLKLVERLAHQISKSYSGMKKELDLQKLYGMGKELWKGEDAQDYVNRLREDRA